MYSKDRDFMPSINRLKTVPILWSARLWPPLKPMQLCSMYAHALNPFTYPYLVSSFSDHTR